MEIEEQQIRTNLFSRRKCMKEDCCCCCKHTDLTKETDSTLSQEQ